MNKKLIFILNHYSRKTEQHFFHVINLLEKIAEKDVEIALIIEKCEDIPTIKNIGITVYSQTKKSKFGRVIELYHLLFKLQKKGYKKVFVRISWVAACLAIIVGFAKKLETYYWLSSQGSIENYRSLNWSFHKFKIFINSHLPFWFIKTYIDHFVTGPESMAEYMNYQMQVPKEKIMVLYNDVDISRFSKAVESEKTEYKNKFGLPPNKKIILFVHRLSPVRKTLFYIPYIITEFFKVQSKSDFHFAFAGKGPEENDLRKAIKDAGIAEYITILGAVPNNEIAELYKSADLFINPTYAEGFPRVLIEAMACGLPIVTTNAGGIVDILCHSQKEFMIAKEDRILFAQKLIELSNNQQLQNELTQQNLIHVKHFSTEAIADMYVNKLGLNHE